MTGPNHYLAAERLLDDADRASWLSNLVVRRGTRAQAHATLALVAATVPVAEGIVNDPVDGTWDKVLGL